MSKQDAFNEQLPWTFSLWLSLQQERKDRVGATGRRVARDRTWPGWREIDGLEEYMREQGADEEKLRDLRQAYKEWKQENHHR